MLQRFVFAAILLGLVCAALIDAEEDAEFNDRDLQEVQDIPTRLIRTSKVRWMDEYERRMPSWWMRRRRGGKKKTRKNKVTKRLKRKQRRRMRVKGRGDGFRFVDDGRFDQLDDFIPTGQLQDDKMMDDASPIRIRIRLKRRGPVKRDAKKSKRRKLRKKKKSKKQKKKCLAELAEKEAMTKVLKDFLNSRRRRGRKRSKKMRLKGLSRRPIRP